ncbi:MAG: alcohol dehydrogenase catalytic domain-containing protein [Planctomycetaceae bacterium]|jgi:L-iditol 2-dehydrogenase|nr:alcohol dehydrogenase catalytic domain-containing protein [Planctomycetaceae bacterium]
MQAIVYYAPGDIRVENVPKPVCGDGELLVKVDACAVCGTDLKSKNHGNPRIKAPLVMGHEFTGIVEQVSPSATGGFQIGDRIVMATSVSCGECHYCKHGYRNLCASLAPMGFTYAGGMAEYVAIPALALRGGHVVKVPAEVEAKCAALAEPVSCAVNAVTQCRVQKGDTVLVMGAGPMGLLNAVVARAMGAEKIILSEPNPLRLNQVKSFGIDIPVNPASQDLTQVVKDATDGLGADIVIVAAPAALPQEQALSLVRKQGTVCLFASLPAGHSSLTIDSRILHYGEIHVIGSSDSTPEHVQKAVELIAAKQIPADRIASHLLPFDQIEKAFELMTSGEALRVVLVPPIESQSRK